MQLFDQTVFHIFKVVAEGDEQPKDTALTLGDAIQKIAILRHRHPNKDFVVRDGSGKQRFPS